MNTSTIYLQEQIQRSLVAIRKLKEENKKLREGEGKDPIAVIGVSCKLPGEIESISNFWKSLVEGEDLISEIPNYRWNTHQFYNPDKNSEGTYYTKYSGVLKRNIKAFDASFFNISPIEAKYMDPQQRLLLEAAWEVFENANYPPGSFQKSETGVFIGIASIDNAIRLHQTHVPITAYTGTGNTLSGGAGRIAHFFGLCGPVMSIDTACSSSLVALHQACQSIRNRECSVALVGGVNVLLSADVMINFCQSNMLAQDGRCKTFDESADGYSRGEGVGMVMLKSYSQALKDGDTILGLIKGSAINHDGRSAGLTVPNGNAQEKVIEKALRDANLAPNQIGYIECHGTGTSLGDPIEFEAIANVYGDRNKDNVLRIGSLKTNIGHLEAAAGIVGLIKLILCLKNKMFVPHLHVNQPSTNIPWDKFPQIKLTDKKEIWNVNTEQKARIAGISSFGFTGTNAHVIVEEYVSEEEILNTEATGLDVLTLSAKTENSLINLKKRFVDYLEETDNSLPDIAYSSNVGRDHFGYRFAIPITAKKDLISKLVQQELSSESKHNIPKIAFLFTGQGCQYTKMGIELYHTNSFFKEKIDICDTILKNELDISLIDLLFNSDYEAQLHQTEYSQPAIFAIEYALASLWLHWGIQPKVLVGHSIGELAAACFAGVFTLQDGLKIVAARGRFMQNAPGKGVMYSVNMSGEQLLPYTEIYENISVAAYNSAIQSVVSGLEEEINLLISKLKTEGFIVYQLQVSHAFHSPLMETARVKFHEVLLNVNYSRPTTPILSNYSGKVAGEEIMSPEYWSNQLTKPVHFTACVKEISTFNLDACLEVGPTPILLSLIANTADTFPELIPTLSKMSGTTQSIKNAITSLYNQGAKIDWKKVHEGVGTRKVMLPNYPFQLKEYWIEVGGTDYTEIEVPVEVLNKTKIYQLNWNLKDFEPQVNFHLEKDWLLIEFEEGRGTEFSTLLAEINKGKIKQIRLSASSNNLSTELSEILKEFTEEFNCVIFPKNKFDDVISYAYDGFNFIEIINHLDNFDKIKLLQSFTILNEIESTTSSNSSFGIETLSKVFENEYDLADVNRIIVQEKIDKTNFKSILNEIVSTEKESQIQILNGNKFVQRLVEVKLPNTSEEPLFDKNKSYLITGGTGALGSKLVDWAVENEAKHLVLLSRGSFPDDKIIERYKMYQESGISIEFVKADIANKAEVEGITAKFGSEFPKLDGVFHLSGIVEDGLIVNQSELQFKNVLEPKVNGAWNLHQTTKMMELKFYVQFSSVSSIFGTPGQANYAYANAFMDHLSENRVGQGLKCLNINWGPWSGFGMANQIDSKSHDLIEKISISQGFGILSDLLRGKYQGSFVVGTIDQKRAENKKVSLVMPLVNPVIIEKKDVTITEEKNINSECTINDIHKIISEIIEIPQDQIEIDIPIINYGFDSLLALKAKNKIRKVFGVDLDPSEFMKNPSIQELFATVRKLKIDNSLSIDDERNSINISEKSLDNIDQLSEEEIDALLKALN